MGAADEPPVDPATTALVLIDFQWDVVGTADGEVHAWAVPAIERSAEAADWARTEGIPVVWVRVERRDDYTDVFDHPTDFRLAGKAPTRKRLVTGSHGAKLVDPLFVQPGDYTIVKPRVNAFYCTPLEVFLRRLGTRTLLIGGVYTNMGVEATARAAYDRDFQVVVLPDCCAAYSRDAHEYPLREIFPRIGRVRTLGEAQSLLATVPE